MTEETLPTKKHRIPVGCIVSLVLTIAVGWVLVPALQPLGEKAPHTRRMSYARGIFLSIFGTVIESSLSDEENLYFPDSNRFSNSNEYFIYLMQEGVLPEYWTPITGGGLRSFPETINLEDPSAIILFTEDSNFWSVVADTSIQSHPGIPFLISRNFAEPTLREATGRKDRPNVLNDKRFDDHVYFVTIGGSAGSIPIKGLTWEAINPEGATNKILHPGPPVPKEGKE